jgi:hypothetical protein
MGRKLLQIVGLISAILVLIGIISVLSACGATPTPTPTSTPTPTVTPTPTATPMPSLSGKLTDHDNPGESLRFVLCRRDEDSPYCTIDPSLTGVTTTDGRFELLDVPPGNYYLLYHSGEVDFDSGLQEWSGEVIQIGNIEWSLSLSEQIDIGGIPISSQGFDPTYFMLNVLTLRGQRSEFPFALAVRGRIKDLNQVLLAGAIDDNREWLLNNDVAPEQLTDGLAGAEKRVLTSFGIVQGEPLYVSFILPWGESSK